MNIPFPQMLAGSTFFKEDEKSEILHPVFDFNLLLYRLLVPPYPDAVLVFVSEFEHAE